MIKDVHKPKSQTLHEQEWQQFTNQSAWWEAEQPLQPLPEKLQRLLDEERPEFIQQLFNFAALQGNSYIWNEQKQRYDFFPIEHVKNRDRSWIWTLYVNNTPLAREGLKRLLRYEDQQTFSNHLNEAGTFFNYYYGFRNFYGSRRRQYSVIGPLHYRYLKAIYKLAEKKHDLEILALLAYRFDGDRLYDHNWNSPENTRHIAYQPKTRSYLTRRSWRLLRLLGKQKSSDYVQFATDVLLQYNKEDAIGMFVTDPNTDETMRVPSYKQNWLLHHILYHNSPRFTYSSSSWKPTADAYVSEPEVREEAFAELWDQQPDVLLHLLLHATISPVTQFAARALRLGNPDFVSQIDSHILEQLLQSNDPYRQHFAAQEILKRIDPSQSDFDLWLRLASHYNPNVRKVAYTYLNEHIDKCPEANMAPLIYRCLAMIHENPNAAYIDEWYSLFAHPFRNIAAKTIRLTTLTPLLSHSQPDVHPLVALLLSLIKRSNDPYTAMDLLPFLAHNAEEIRSTAQTIIERDLLQLSLSAKFLAKWCTIDLDESRAFLRTFIPAHKHELLPYLAEWLDELWTTMMRDNLPEDSQTFVQEYLLGELFLEALADTPLDQVLALLEHSETSYQELGTRLLATKQPTANEFSREQLLRLAHNPIARCRKLARDLIIERRTELNDQWLVELVETEWDDTRNWAFAYIRSLSVEQFTPTLIYGLIDSARQDIQAFGMEMVNIHFADLNISEILLRASESTDLFVQEYALSLADKIDWDVEKVRKLELFFRTILFQVHRARKAKQSTLQLLIQLSCKDREMARIIVPLLSDLAQIGGKRDFEQILAALTVIQARYPDIDTPIQLH
jgi:hypothetical protein